MVENLQKVPYKRHVVKIISNNASDITSLKPVLVRYEFLIGRSSLSKNPYQIDILEGPRAVEGALSRLCKRRYRFENSVQENCRSA